MNDQQADEFIRRTNEINDTLLALTTYLKRNQILIDKLGTLNIPPNYLEEWGEFLTDFGEGLTKWGIQNKERDLFLLELFGIKNDN
jgi:hypothetical protein